MYDASLDKIWNNNQSLKIGYNLSVPGTRWMDGYWGMNSYNYWFPSKNLKVASMAYDHFLLPFDYMQGLIMETATAYGSRNASFVGGIKVRGMAKARMDAPMMAVATSDVAEAELAEDADAVVVEEALLRQPKNCVPILPRRLSSIRNFAPMSKEKSLSLSPCRRALPVGISGDMHIPKA